MMESQPSTDGDREGSQIWEDISLADEEYKPSNSPIETKSRPQHKCLTEVMLNFAKESAQLMINATPEFIVNMTLAIMFCLLTYLILRKNEIELNDLEPFQSLCYLWLIAIIGGYLVRIFRLPPLLGMICSSVITTNASDNFQIPDTWGETITSSGLAIILFLSGLELDLNALKKSSGLTTRLTCAPGIVEAISSGLFATLIFGMPIWLGLSLGFILGAVSPALLVVGMMKLQKEGYGVKKGIPSLIIAAASFDDIVAITGFSFFIGLAIQSKHTSVLYSALHGPLSVMIGIGIGLVGGMALSM